MPDVFVPASIEEFESTVRLSDNNLPGLDVRDGQRIRVILNYKVIDKTKSFTVLRITGAYQFPSKRII